MVATMHPGGATTADRADASRRAGPRVDAYASGFHTQVLEFQALR
jgi:hypothetical protein